MAQRVLGRFDFALALDEGLVEPVDLAFQLACSLVTLLCLVLPVLSFGLPLPHLRVEGLQALLGFFFKASGLLFLDELCLSLPALELFERYAQSKEVLLGGVVVHPNDLIVDVRVPLHQGCVVDVLRLEVLRKSS